MTTTNLVPRAFPSKNGWGRGWTTTCLKFPCIHYFVKKNPHRLALGKKLFKITLVLMWHQKRGLQQNLVLNGISSWDFWYVSYKEEGHEIKWLEFLYSMNEEVNYWAACAPSHKMGFRSSAAKNGLPGEGRHEGVVPRNRVVTNGFIWFSLARTFAWILFVPRLRSPWKTHKALRTWRRLFALFEAIRSWESLYNFFIVRV